MLLKTITLLLAPTSHALYFCIWPIAAYDKWKPIEVHNLTFVVSNPAAAYEQGGSEPVECNIGWSVERRLGDMELLTFSRTGCDPPTCWKSCTGHNNYYAKITPGTYKGAYDFSLDIWQEYVYELANHNNATIKITEGTSNYECTYYNPDERDCTTCTSSTFEQTLQAYYGGGTPTGSTICA